MIWIFLSVVCVCFIIFLGMTYSFVKNIGKEIDKPQLSTKEARAIVARKLLTANDLLERNQKQYSTFNVGAASSILKESAKYVKEYPELEKYFTIADNQVVLAGLTKNELELWAGELDTLKSG